MSGIFDAYLAGTSLPFFGEHFADAAHRARAVARAMRPLAPEVANVLAAQNARFAGSTARDSNLEALRRGAAAVVTGQQVGLFLGPLFTLYKAAGAIAAARALARETGHAVVPVFWLQTEDHDLPEIAECNVPCPERGPVALRLPSSAGKLGDARLDRVSLEHRVLPDEVRACLDRLRAEIEHLPHAAPHLERLERHYRPGAGWVDAFAGLLSELFADDGLVLIDSREPTLARLSAPVHRRAICEAESIAEGLLARGRSLVDEGYAVTVHVRAGSPLSFFHPEGEAGPRYRLEPVPGGFAEVGGERVHTRDSLLAALDDDPLRFSTSALLRPIVQDTLLPTAAYVAGPGEVAYFAQLAPLYCALGMTMPLVVPRPRFRLVDDRIARLLTQLELQPADVEHGEDEVLAASKRGLAPAAAELNAALLAPFEDALDRLRPQLEAAGPGLDTAVEKTRATVEMAVSKLALKLEKARLHGDQRRVDEVRRLRRLLFPNDAPQERCFGISWFAARYGERELVERVLGAIEPYDARVHDIDCEAHR